MADKKEEKEVTVNPSIKVTKVESRPAGEGVKRTKYVKENK